MNLRDGELELVTNLIKDLCGLVLDATKGYLIEGRLGDIAQRAGCSDFQELYFRVKDGGDVGLRQKVIDAITTHESMFFRDRTPFDAMQSTIVPQILSDRVAQGAGPRLRMWSAACSAGQEAYSMAIMALEAAPSIARDHDFRVIGTDISQEMIDIAKSARYSRSELDRCTRQDLVGKYFRADRGDYVVVDEVRELVEFRALNLLQPLAHIGQCDLVMCRNVAIYFDAATRADLFRRIARQLPQWGYLMVGSSESLRDLGPPFVDEFTAGAVCYRPNRPHDTVSSRG